jgi:hypothetical protein
MKTIEMVPAVVIAVVEEVANVVSVQGNLEKRRSVS